MQKTIVVTVERLTRHVQYGKFLRRSTRFYAHDAKSEAKDGDLVEIQECRPLSRLKRWRLVRVVEQTRYEGAVPVEAVAGTAETAAAKAKA